MNEPKDGGSRRSEPAAMRNREPILGVLQPLLDDPATPPGAMVETAAGIGIHACFFAPRFPARPWLASDRQAENVAAIAERIAAEGAPNLLPPARLDVGAEDWAAQAAAIVSGPVAAILNVNMIHISPWSAGCGLLAGAGQLLLPDGVLVLYGPYRIGGAHTGEGNAGFDARLRARNPEWGIRDLDDVTAVAASHGLRLEAVVTMPSDNRTIVFRRAA
jgi:hypothetical protein